MNAEINIRTNYVLGFYFSTDGKSVILLNKNRPIQHKGKLNGVGGKIEAGEIPIEAMKREFFEEAGLKVDNWDEFCVFRSDKYNIHVFRTFGDEPPVTMTDEVVLWYRVSDVIGETSFKTFNSLRWLIPMGLDDEIKYSKIEKTK